MQHEVGLGVLAPAWGSLKLVLLTVNNSATLTDFSLGSLWTSAAREGLVRLGEWEGPLK